ncbi:MAG TPA: FAD:protein FMN transferase [Candidatus Saccharimonadales bacterium]|nr:FAD:protein FMN transferase [Candidatus Saccharimonadales bacterium]
MKQTEIIMGMPITVEIPDKDTRKYVADIFSYFKKVDARYSTYKDDSEISQINNGLPKSKWSAEMKKVLVLCEQTKKDTKGYFNITHNGKRDPSGLVKGWAINNAANMLRKKGVYNFCIEAGGDIQVNGQDTNNKPWTVGIRNPFNIDEVVKTITVGSEGVATSGTYVRGQHIYDPFNPNKKLNQVKSITVIGSDIYEADRYATAAFAMGVDGINFIKNIPRLEGYMITNNKAATYTSGFERYVVNV